MRTGSKRWGSATATVRFVVALLPLLLIPSSSGSLPPASPRHSPNKKVAGQEPDSEPIVFSPRMDYEEWTPLGPGDPLKNNPTFDYAPPVLDRVQYWMNARTTEPSVKRDILVLGVTAKKTSPQIPAQFFELVEGPKLFEPKDKKFDGERREPVRGNDFTGSTGAEPPKIQPAANFRRPPVQKYKDRKKTPALLNRDQFPKPTYYGQASGFSTDARRPGGKPNVGDRGVGAETYPFTEPFRSPSRDSASVTLEKSNLIYQSTQTISGGWLTNAVSSYAPTSERIPWQGPEYTQDQYDGDYHAAASSNHQVLIAHDEPASVTDHPSDQGQTRRERPGPPVHETRREEEHATRQRTETEFSKNEGQPSRDEIDKNNNEREANETADVLHDPSTLQKMHIVLGSSPSSIQKATTKGPVSVVMATNYQPENSSSYLEDREPPAVTIASVSPRNESIPETVAFTSSPSPTAEEISAFTPTNAVAVTEASSTVTPFLPAASSLSSTSFSPSVPVSATTLISHSTSTQSGTSLSTSSSFTESNDVPPGPPRAVHRSPSLMMSHQQLPQPHYNSHSRMPSHSHPHPHLYSQPHSYPQPHSHLHPYTRPQQYSMSQMQTLSRPGHFGSGVRTGVNFRPTGLSIPTPMSLPMPMPLGMSMAMPMPGSVAMSFLPPMSGHASPPMAHMHAPPPPQITSSHGAAPMNLVSSIENQPPHHPLGPTLIRGSSEEIGIFKPVATARPGTTSPLAALLITNSPVREQPMIPEHEDRTTASPAVSALYPMSSTTAEPDTKREEDAALAASGKDEVIATHGNETADEGVSERSTVGPPRAEDTTALASLTTDPIFSHYKQPAKPIRGPMYLIIQGHSKVKTYKPTVTNYEAVAPRGNEIPEDERAGRRQELSKFDEYVKANTRRSTTSSEDQGASKKEKHQRGTSVADQKSDLMSLISEGAYAGSFPDEEASRH